MSDTNALVFVRRDMAEPEPPPLSVAGPLAWVRTNLFASILSTLMTIFGALLSAWLIWILVDFALLRAVFTGNDGEVCRVPGSGACWPYVKTYWSSFIYGRYPIPERWRVDIVYWLFAILLIPMAMPSFPGKKLNGFLLLVVFPVVAFELLLGGKVLATLYPAVIIVSTAIALLLTVRAVTAHFGKRDRSAATDFAAIFFLIALVMAYFDDKYHFTGITLVPVETDMWGGLLVTLVVAVTGIVASLPAGILLALGRRSKMPVIRLLSIAYIEFWRGVPLITVLFMASTMLPLFVPKGIDVDKLLRALVGVAMFSAAYMAENVRGGLQAIPKGQYEGAMALGLGYWQMMRLIIMPQALKLVIPAIVGTFISLFKDTTLVLIVSIFDLLGQIQASRVDPVWAAPSTAPTGYLVAALIYFVFCYGMSQYSRFMERRLNRGRKH